MTDNVTDIVSYQHNTDVNPRLLSSTAAAAAAHVWGVGLYPYILSQSM